jgi:hypothetical protein
MQMHQLGELLFLAVIIAQFRIFRHFVMNKKPTVANQPLVRAHAFTTSARLHTFQIPIIRLIANAIFIQIEVLQQGKQGTDFTLINEQLTTRPGRRSELSALSCSAT